MAPRLINADALIPYIKKATAFCKSLTEKIAPPKEETILVPLTRLQLNDLVFMSTYYLNNSDIKPQRFYTVKTYLEGRLEKNDCPNKKTKSV